MSKGTTGQLIRNARLKAALSQGMVAQKLGVTNSLVSHWEAGRRVPEDLASLAQVLGVPVEVFTSEGSPLSPQGRADFRRRRLQCQGCVDFRFRRLQVQGCVDFLDVDIATSECPRPPPAARESRRRPFPCRAS